jgi:C1A family cysteine protease
MFALWLECQENGGTMAKKKTTKRAAAAGRGTTSAVPVLRRICNVVPSKGTEHDWRFQDAVASGALGAVAALPASVDLRAAWWAIDDQEDTGSCVGWATAEGVVRYHMVQAGKLAKTTLLSPRFVWMASKETDEFTSRPETFIEEAGTSLKAAMDIVRKYGAVTMSTLPFHISTKMYGGPENTFYALAAQLRVTSYFNLLKDQNQWKAWLASHGPILAALSVDHSWDNATATGGNIDTFMPSTVRGGHAVAIVGYTSSGRFIVRNSWGTGWGDKGFGYVSSAYVAAAFSNESYGATV